MKSHNTLDATGTSHTAGPATMTVKRLSPAQAEERKRKIAQEIHRIATHRGSTDPYFGPVRVEVRRPGFSPMDCEILNYVGNRTWHPGVVIRGTGPYLASLFQAGRITHEVRGETELKALKELLKYVETNLR